MRSAGARRAWNLLLLLVYVLATGASMALIGLIASERSARWDVTMTGALDLAPRTRGILGSLEGEYEIVAAYDRTGVPRAIGDRVDDVLEELDRRSEHVRLTRIDVTTAAGGSQLRELATRLRDRDAARIGVQLELLGEGIGELEGAIDSLESLSGALMAIRNAIPDDAVGAATNRAYFEQQSGVAGFGATELREKAPQLRRMLDEPGSVTGVPDTRELADAVVASLEALIQQHDALGSQVRAFSEAQTMPAEARSLARPLARVLADRRDHWAVIADGLARLERPDVVRVSGALERSQALLVIGPPGKGVTAVDLSQILPTDARAFEAAGVSAAAQMARRTEELVATAIGSLSSPARPVVVVVHGEPTTGLVASGALSAAMERLALRGIDVAEWAAAVEEDEPDLSSTDPGGERPVVWLVVNTNSAVASREGDALGGTKRAQALGAAVDALVGRGESVLVSINPSVFPSFGDVDPTVRALGEFGIRAHSGTPLVQREVTPQGSVVGTETVVVAGETESAVGGAIANLGVRLPWAIPMEIDEGAGARAVLTRAGGEAVWGERQWLRLWQTSPEMRPFLREQPTRDDGTDLVESAYAVAAIGTRVMPSTGKPQRIVAVGSNGWLLTPVLERTTQVVGGSVYQSGNLELLEAAVYWLAGRDELVARSSQGRIAVVEAMDAGRMRVIAWSLIIGLPMVILGVGGVWRLARG